MSNRNRNRIRDSNNGICDAVRKEINRYITMWNEDRITFLKEFSPYMVTGYMGDIVSKNVSRHLEAGSLEAVIDTFQEIINLTADYIPSLALKDISYGIAFALCFKLLVYAKSLDSKKFRKGEEYGSASFGTKADIDPFMDKENFFNNVILSATEKISLAPRMKDPANNRNKNVLIVGGSGSGKTSLCIYKEFYGNIDVPRRYTDANHLYLGRWLERQKSFYREGQLPHEQVQKLEALGCKWSRDLDRRFESMFQLLCDYKEKYGNVNVPPKFKTAQGESLGNWCNNLRARYRLGKIDEDRVRRLDEIGFIWQPYMSNWDECYAYAKEYYETHGDLKVPKRYVCEDGYKLGLWIYTQRRVREGAVKGNISEEQIKRLDEIGMEWTVIKNDRFDEYVEAFIQYKKKMGTCKIPSDYVNEDGLLMGHWAYRMKRNYREGKLPEEKYRKLDELGFLWNDYNGQWYKQYEKAKAFYEEYGHLSVSAKYTKEHGGTLSQWLNNQKKEYMKEDHGKLDDEQTALLESLNIELRNRKDVLFMKGLAALKKYADEYGDTLVPRDYVSKEGYHLGNWVRHIKDKYKYGKLTDKQLLSLNEIPMCFESIEIIRARQYWDTMYEEAKKYYKEHGNLNVPDKYETENGRKLYNWIAQQRRIRKGTVKHSIELTEERISKLDALGMNWGK